MGKECEIDILDVNRKEVARRLRQLRAKHEGLHRFRRIEFLIEGDTHGRHSWARVRTDGKETTITLKETYGKAGFTSMKEYEVRADGFEDAVRIMSRLTKSKVLYWENERDAYRLGDVQVTIDKWPGIPALVEIEAPTMRKVKEAYRRLGISGRFVGNTPIHKVYEMYGLDFRAAMAKNEPKLKKLLAKG
jgi:adenylate cyclase class IV